MVYRRALDSKALMFCERLIDPGGSDKTQKRTPDVTGSEHAHGELSIGKAGEMKTNLQAA